MQNGSYLREKISIAYMARSDILVLGGLFAIAFGMLILLSNPAEVNQFPLNMSPLGWIGMVLLFGGVAGIYYGAKD